MSHSHGELLSVHAINQAWPGAPQRAEKTQQAKRDTARALPARSWQRHQARLATLEEGEVFEAGSTGDLDGFGQEGSDLLGLMGV
jgi:hypothetical protein